MMNKIYRFILLFFILLSSNSAFAACTSPAGAASQTRYDFGLNKMYYCNDTDWIESGGGSSSVSIIDQYVLSGVLVSPVVISMTNNKWPDYIVCQDTAANNGITISIRKYVNNSTISYDSQGGSYVYDFHADGSFLVRTGTLAMNCGASGSDIDSICNDNRCGFH